MTEAQEQNNKHLRPSQRLTYVEKENFFGPVEGHTRSYPFLKQPAVFRSRLARFRRYLKNVVAADPDEILKASDIQMANDKLLKFYSYGNVISYATLVVTTILT